MNAGFTAASMILPYFPWLLPLRPPAFTVITSVMVVAIIPKPVFVSWSLSGRHDSSGANRYGGSSPH
jgi:hypothetical protein